MVSRVDSEPTAQPEPESVPEPSTSRRELVLLLGLFIGAPLVLLVLKQTGLPAASFLRRHDSLAGLPQSLHGVVANILLVPLGSLVVVSFRLTLGLRVLGPFRSILLAFAFLSTGILVGLAFFAATVAILIFSRPLVRALRLPYFGRVSVMLSLVAVLLVIATLAGTWLSSAALRGVAHFPIVVLCLIGEAVSKAIRTEGAVVGVWRASMTALGAVLVTAVASVGGLRELLLRNPELMLIETAAIAFVARFCAWRLLDWLNPGARKSAPRPVAVSG
jgi:hypothetical protein